MPTRITMTALGVAFLASACASSAAKPEEGDAFLTIVGDRNVLLDFGQQMNIAVRYHNGADEPLAGEVTLEVGGSTNDSRVAATSGVTDAQGIVTFGVTGGQQPVSFHITATAEFAEPTEWSVSVSEGAKPLPLDLEGKYDLNSRFDLSTSLPGTLGSIVGTLTELGDSPGKWLLEHASIPGASFLGPLLDGVIEDHAPQLVNDVLAMADKISQASRNFGTATTLEVKKGSTPGSSTATLTLTKFQFKIDNQDVTLSLEEMGAEPSVVKDVVLTVDQNAALAIAEHGMPIPYGAFLAKAFNEMIVPAIDPTAYTFEDLLQKNIDCVSIGFAIRDAIGFGSASTYENACRAGVTAGAQAAVSELAQIDERAPLVLKVTGSAKVKDADSDRRVDEISNGKWAGALEYAGAQGPLTADGAVFTAARMR